MAESIGSRLWSLLSHQIGMDEGVLKATFGGMSDALLRGETLTVPDFGTFRLDERPPTRKWQPRHNDYQDMPARRALVFRAAVEFRRMTRPTA